STLTYTYRFANGGTTAALGTHIDQTTPPNTTFASVAGVTGCTTPAAGSAGAISCPIGTLNPGASGSFSITVNVAAGATGNIVNGNYWIGSVNQPALLGAKVTTAVRSPSRCTAPSRPARPARWSIPPRPGRRAARPIPT